MPISFFLLLESVEDELLVVLHGCLEIAHGDVLVRSMCYENRSRAVEVTSVVAFQVRDIRAVVDDN